MCMGERTQNRTAVKALYVVGNVKNFPGLFERRKKMSEANIPTFLLRKNKFGISSRKNG